MVYYFTFLFPHYMAPVYKESNPEKRQEYVDTRGISLSKKSFRAMMAELLENLYMHV
jgi:hypothetical protein